MAITRDTYVPLLGLADGSHTTLWTLWQGGVLTVKYDYAAGLLVDAQNTAHVYTTSGTVRARIWTWTFRAMPAGFAKDLRLAELYNRTGSTLGGPFHLALTPRSSGPDDDTVLHSVDIVPGSLVLAVDPAPRAGNSRCSGSVQFREVS